MIINGVVSKEDAHVKGKKITIETEIKTKDINKRSCTI